jgi:plasmid replication initiation protein
MSDEHITEDADEIRTLETLGVTPRFVLQHNAISRSIQNLSANAKKLTAMALALLPPDLSSLTVSFTFTDFCKALGVSVGGEQYHLFKAAATECMKCIIHVETDKIVKGKRKWQQYTWFIYSEFDEETGVCTMIFSSKLAAVLLEMKRVYAKINLEDFGRLQSKYALRYFEIAKSYESLAGKNGNPSGSWYFERTIPELRELLSVAPDSYTETRDFRKKVVEGPVKEINKSGIGLEICTEGIKQGRNLKGIRFDCKKTPRTVSKKGKKKAADSQLEVPEPSPKVADQREEKELNHLMELYPDEFVALYEEALSKQKVNLGEFSKRSAKAEALSKLKQKHGIMK